MCSSCCCCCCWKFSYFLICFSVVECMLWVVFRCELRIVSDANLFYIETILKHHGIMECFSEIYTNPGYVDKEGRLRIRPYHDFHSSSHGCNNVCPPNMCKVDCSAQIPPTNQNNLTQEEKQLKASNDFAWYACKGKYSDAIRIFPVSTWYTTLFNYKLLQKLQNQKC